MRNLSRNLRYGLVVTLIGVSTLLAGSRREGINPPVDVFEGVLMVGTCKVIDYSPIFKTPDGGRNPDEYSANLRGYAYPGQILPAGMRAVTGREYAQRINPIGKVQVTITGTRYLGRDGFWLPIINVNIGKECRPEGY